MTENNPLTIGPNSTMKYAQIPNQVGPARAGSPGLIKLNTQRSNKNPLNIKDIIESSASLRSRGRQMEETGRKADEQVRRPNAQTGFRREQRIELNSDLHLEISDAHSKQPPSRNSGNASTSSPKKETGRSKEAR